MRDEDDNSNDDKKDNESDTEEAQEDGTEGKKKRHRKRKRKRKTDDEQQQQPKNEEKSKDKDAPEEDERAAQVDRTVFVEGIPFTASPQDVKDFFIQHDLKDLEECRLPVWQDSGRLRGYGHIVFESVESKEKAKTLSGKYLKDRYLTITEAKKPKDQHRSESTSAPSRTLLVANLSYEATEEDIEKVMEKFGTIVDGGVRVVRHSAEHRRSKGFAYVEFEDIETATAVMKERIEILNRPCRTDYDHGRIKGSFRTASGRFWNKEHRSGDAPKRHREAS